MLRARVEDDLVPLVEGRILSFDEPASASYAAIRSRARSQGKAIGDLDAVIASVASSRGFAVATRDVAPFLAADVAVINPFE
jgi:toxin FitB